MDAAAMKQLAQLDSLVGGPLSARIDSAAMAIARSMSVPRSYSFNCSAQKPPSAQFSGPSHKSFQLYPLAEWPNDGGLDRRSGSRVCSTSTTCRTIAVWNA